jgi:dipeptidyl aminopeptidase/acylaminoacyl peptidase
VADVPGPGGTIETLVVGDVVTARHVVVALHGGPFAAWRSAYHPLFNALAAEGVAVVAPNIRGSLGYGRAHAHAIRDRWGDVDAADVRAVCHWLAGRRDPKAMPPVLVGESYGAYLAVLVAASSAPGTVSGCAAMSGFTSGARVAGLGSAVSQLVLRFGGHTCPDLLVLAAAVPVPVLLLHGDLDEVVPVRESVDLAAALAAGGVPVRLVRDQVGGHDLMASPNGRQHRRRLLNFVLDPGTARHIDAHREGVNT